MKSRKAVVTVLIASALSFAGVSMAQDAPASGSSTTVPTSSSSFQSPSGPVTIRSVPPAATPVGQAPSFKDLAGNGKAISQDQAAAYPPLANDFLHADSNHNGSITKAEYDRWVKQL